MSEPRMRRRKERRRVPRVRARIPIKLATKGGVVSVSGRSWDLSSTGAYCRVGRLIPLNSEVDVRLELPGSSVLCKGVVVRNKKGTGRDKYGIALFFSDISASGKQNIVEYIDGKLKEEGIKTRPFRKRVREFVEKKSYVSRRKGLEISSAKFRVLEGDVMISSKGLSCRTDRKVPLFKEIAVNILLPSGRRGRREAIQCNGVVVSCDKVRGRNRYDLTIYFVELSRRDKAEVDSFTRSGRTATSSRRK